VIDIPSFTMQERDLVALCGSSGLGKTTLLHLIAGIIRPDAGRITLQGKEISALDEPNRDRIRAHQIGYIFQTFNLLPAFTCLENVLLGMSFGARTDRPFAEHLLERVGMSTHLRHYPRQLSTGQQQRVAVARALANHPQLVLADEPTGNLDAGNARGVLQLIRETCQENGAALLLVSHDRHILEAFETVLELGKLNRASDVPVREEKEGA